LANHGGGHNREGNRCPFNRLPRRIASRSPISTFRSAVIIISIIFGIIGAILGGGMMAMLGSIPGVKM